MAVVYARISRLSIVFAMNVRDCLKTYLAGGVNSPVRSFKHLEREPIIVSAGKGPYITDIEGNHYIDYCGSWGSLIHGHAPEEIVEEAICYLKKGSSFGITTAIEGILARKVSALVPSLEQMRFVCSGTEATMTAARLARGFTGRPYIVKFVGHYHGHADFFLVQAGSGVMNLSQTSSSAGIPDDIVKYTLCLPFNDEKALVTTFKERGSQIAAVILEPVAGNMGVVQAEPGFMQTLKELTVQSGALLIFDEVITGFRVAKGGAQSYYGIKPDLSTFGKIIGGGFPVACVGGRKDIMAFLAPEGTVYQAGTLAGNPVAMAAGLKCLELLEREGFYEDLQQKADFLLAPLTSAIRGKAACLNRVGSMFTLFFGPQKVENAADLKDLDSARFKHFYHTMLEEGIYLSPAQNEASFISAAHSEEDLVKTRDAILKYVNGYL